MDSKIILSYLLLVLFPMVHSFGSFFGGGFPFGDDEEEEQQHKKPSREPKATLCNGYLCPLDHLDADYYGTKKPACVFSPKDCPCIGIESKKCVIGDWYICVHRDAPCPKV